MIANAAWSAEKRAQGSASSNANREEVDTLLESSAIPLGRGRSVSADVSALRPCKILLCLVAHCQKRLNHISETCE